MAARLAGEVALISGGASGLGLAIVDRFVNEGARLGVLDRSEQGCEELQAKYGDAIVCTIGDVRELEDNDKAVNATVDAFGKLDCAIGNAGIWDYNAFLADMPAEKLSDSFDELFRINVLGYINLAKAAVKPLVRSQGSMVFTVSNAGFMPNGGGVLYTATKHAVVGMIRQLAYEFAPHVRVNGVAPGAISTQLRGPQSLGMEEREFPGENIAARADGFVPLGRMIEPREYASGFVFFADRNDNAPATGSVLNYDGGLGVRGIGPVPRGGDDLREKLGL